MGCVYQALSPQGETVALKMMSAKAASQPDYREMFDHEVQALKKLSHPAIVKIVGEPFSDSNGNIYLPMEYIEGRTLSAIVHEEGPFDEQKALDIFVQLLDAFSYIHSMACIHRDVKPSNVMIRPDGSVCVIDFGIAKDSKTSTGKTIGRIVGTDGYMSPEQANGYNIDSRTDIYSLGCLLHYMLCGSHAIPKQSNDYETICAILENDFPLISDRGYTVSDRTQRAILTAVNKNMTLRFQTANEFKAALTGHSICRISVGRSGCDINMPGEYISGHHLDVIWEAADSDNSSYKVTIQDHSRNGTGVNGRKLLNDSYSFTTTRLPSLNGDNRAFPQVMLSGLPDYVLDWRLVADKLYRVLDIHTSVLHRDQWGKQTLDEPETVVPVVRKDLSLISSVVSFLVPPVGWLFYFASKVDAPEKAGKANRMAWFGCVFYFVIIVLSSI